MWGKDGVDYVTASTYMTSEKTSKVTVEDYNAIKKNSGTDIFYWYKKGQTGYSYLENCGYTYINGVRTALDVKLETVQNTSANGFCMEVINGTYLRICSGEYYTGKNVKTAYDGVDIWFYFYKHGDNYTNPLTVNGTMTLQDIDTNEGWKLGANVTGVYLTSDIGSYIGYDNSWLLSARDNNAGDKRGSAMITFTSSKNSRLHLRYRAGGKGYRRTSTIVTDDVSIIYQLVGNTNPTNAYVPQDVLLASGANTEAAKNIILGDYRNYPGYTFSGWKTRYSGNSVYGDFTGSACQTSNVYLYGTYTKQTGGLTVSKTITGIDQSFIDSIPDANKNFPFTLSGTSASGESYRKDFKVVAGKDVTISDIPEGTYTLTESYGNKWWTCTSTNPQSVTITKGGTATASFTNKIATGNLTIKKKLANIESDAISNEEDKKFKFTLYGTADYQVTVNETKELIGSGSVTFSGIPVGTYTLKESYYDGELWTPSVITQQVTIEKDVSKEVTVTNTFIPERTPQPAPEKSFDGKKGIENKRINKRSDEVTFSIFQQVKASDHEAVAPVKLTINDALDKAFEYKGFKAYVSVNAGTSWTEDTASFKDATKGNEVSLYKEKNTFLSAEWYRFDITVKVKDDIHLDDYIQDVNGTNMYVIPNTASSTFTYKSGTPTDVTQKSNTVNVRIPLDELSIVVKKSNEVTGENIPNAEFTVYEWNGTAYKDSVGKMSYDEYQKNYIIKNLRKTDTNQGKFKIVETVTPWGHVGSWSKEIVVGTNATETYTATNPMGMGTITVLKKGKHEEVLAGAVYSIKAKENIVSPQGKVLVTAGTEVDKVTTGKDGTAKSKELYPGRYTITETNAPLGYAINKAPQDVEVTYKDKDTKVTNASVTFVNDRLYSTITVTKQIDTADIVWEHGNPTFTFKVDGKDVLGNAHTYYKTVEFTKNNVGSGAKASLSAKFTVLAGTYTVSEEKTARYKFGSITDVVNGTISGQTAVLDVSGKKDGTVTEGANGAATFYNVKATDEDLTHTAFVDNTIA